MSTGAFALVLGSAVLHAGWNFAIKSSQDRLATAGGQVILGALAFSPLLLVVGLPHGTWHWVALSSVVHMLYGLSLVGAYERGDLSAMYPVARGTAPALVTAGAAVLLQDSVGGEELTAVALIVVGIMVIGVSGRPTGVPWALLTGLFITAYTLIDGHAVRQLDDSIGYTVAVFLGNAVIYFGFLLYTRGPAGMAHAIRTDGRRQLLGGSASALAYTLVLVAARIAPLGLVSAVRETSVVFGALAGWLLLGESLGGRRLAAATSIAIGLVLIALL